MLRTMGKNPHQTRNTTLVLGCACLEGLTREAFAARTAQHGAEGLRRRCNHTPKAKTHFKHDLGRIRSGLLAWWP